MRLFIRSFCLTLLLAVLVGIGHVSAHDYTGDPVVDTRKIMAGTVTTQRIKNEYLSGARDGTTVFKGALAAYKAIRAAEAVVIPPPPDTVCPDGSKVPAGQTCPVPPAPISVPDVTCNEGIGTCVGQITRADGDISKAITVDWHIDNDTAQPGVDYERRGGTLTIPAGAAIGLVSFPILDNTTVDGTRRANIVVTRADAPILDGVGVVTIGDNDVAPTPTPTPQPGPVNDNMLAIGGDSLGVVHPGNYAGTYCASRPSVTCKALAVGGTTLVTMQPQFDQALALKPEVFAILPGANDLGDQIRYPTVTAWLNYLFSRTDPLRAAGIKVIVGTPLIQQNNPPHNGRLAEARAGILAAVGSRIDGAFDSGNPAGPMGTWSTTNFQDPVHPTYSCGYDCGGQGKIATIFRPVADAALGVAGTTPTPTPQPGPIVSLTGEPPIQSPFDYNLSITKTGFIPGSGRPDVVGAFRFICGAGQISNDDPILFPGQPGKSHLHQFYGNTSANAHSTYASLRAAGGSTCNNIGDPFLATSPAANRSAYWMPAMLDGKGNVVKPDYVSIYYKQRPQSDPTVSNPADPKYLGKAIQLPNGIKFIFGWDPTGLNPGKTGGTWFTCQGPTAGSGKFQTLVTALNNCPAGNQLGAVIEAPECWDGKNLDSADHRSHVAYASYGTWGYLKCPSTHPYNIPTFTLGAWYTVAAGDNTSLWKLSSDHMAPGQPTGHTFHADFFMAWDPKVHDMWWQNCILKLLNCSGGQLGNGYDLKGAGQPHYGWKNPQRLVAHPSA